MPVFCVFCSLIMWAFLGWNIIAFSLCAHSFSLCCTASTWLLSTSPGWGVVLRVRTHALAEVRHESLWPQADSSWASCPLGICLAAAHTGLWSFEALRRRGPPPSVPPQLPFGPSHAPPAPLSLLLAELFLLCSWPMWPFIFSGVCPLKYIICILSNFAKSDRKSVAWLFLGVCEQTATHLR